ncbi:TPA: LacI family DNA-binding transcriptional regulator [Providencia stuartii]|uniref:LacI family DNA-binding transcriptional regulator n=1 Tax=Providencia stuartii TaxID=588 RepID=UPI0009788AE3|nr:LacI family DNA-binding transcriptional regulator [Providencia stuartii]OMH52460.1 transcriptional regulator [Providencia stuartii]HEM8863218.1 LacI family DNA-binding transcriptional regulator [Providencia stuartii]HEM8866925.1 LacI family DNA-binding transcriptional regulator [Providencia stuartii]
MSTMQEVAKRANVSKATVSRVLSGKGYTSEETKVRVYQAIEETGYRPNLLARHLSTSKSACIGLVVTNNLYQGSYFNEILSQAAKKLEDNGRQLLLVDGKHSAEEEHAAIQFLLGLRCDAIIVYSRFLSISQIDEIIDQHTQPIMVVNRKLRKNHSHCVVCDHRGASVNATQYLISRGHKEIAFITGSMDSPTAIERLSGYKDALSANGIDINESLIISGHWTPSCGTQAVIKLQQQATPFTAILASNDDMAIGAIKALDDAGITVPYHVSVIGFDDIPLAPFLKPALSSIKDPISAMINEAIHRTISMLDGGYFSKENIFTSELKIRDSVADGPYL